MLGFFSKLKINQMDSNHFEAKNILCFFIMMTQKQEKIINDVSIHAVYKSEIKKA